LEKKRVVIGGRSIELERGLDTYGNLISILQKTPPQKSDFVILFGGAFDPIQNAHIEVLKRVILEIKKKRPDQRIRLFIIPSTERKDKKPKASFEERYHMIELAKEGIDFGDHVDVHKTNLELKRGNSYTNETLDDFRLFFGNQKIGLIVGEDWEESFHTWKNYEEILKKATIIKPLRKKEGLKKSKIDSIREAFERFSIILDEQGSSSEVRALIGQLDEGNDSLSCKSESIRKLKQLLPEKVFQYILENDSLKKEYATHL
jgi:nicotinate (nicotinamide) nucleotide adenylyltransferase